MKYLRNGSRGSKIHRDRFIRRAFDCVCIGLLQKHIVYSDVVFFLLISKLCFHFIIELASLRFIILPKAQIVNIVFSRVSKHTKIRQKLSFDSIP